MNPLELAQALDRERDSLYDEAKKLVDGVDRLELDNSQLHALEGVANLRNEVRAVAEFVKKQAARDSKKLEGWRAQAGSGTLADALAKFSETAAQERAKSVLASLGDSVPSLTDKQRKQQIQDVTLSVIRSFISAFAVHYRYLKSTERNRR